MPLDPVFPCPLQDRATGKLGPVVADDASRLAIVPHQRVELAREPYARNAGITTTHRFSRQPLSLFAKMRSRREVPNVAATKLIDHRSFNRSGTGIGVRLPRARVRRCRRHTDRPSSRYSR